MNFTMAFKPQPLMSSKQALFGKFTGFLNLVDIQPWPGPATWTGQTQVSVAAAALESTHHIRPELGIMGS